MVITEMKPTAIDLFSGAGGLTDGLKAAGFNVVAAIEINPNIAKTYEVNHPDTKLIVSDIRKVSSEDIFSAIDKRKIDIVAGCPPCQGFCSLTSKYKKEDPRNNLLLEMGRLIEEISPTMVMVENVPGLAKKGKTILDEFIEKLNSLDYRSEYKVLQLADYGIPQTRRRFVLLAGKGFSISFPEPTHCKKGDRKRKLKPWLKLDNVLKKEKKPVALSYALKNGGPQKYNWHVVRDLKEISLKRLAAINEGDSRQSLPKKLRPDCHIDSNKGFTNVYGRLSWDSTPPTITSGCTTPAMGRFGHPDELRTISVREAALIQTFKNNYKFETEFMDTVCNLVGNALPPKFARIISKSCHDSLNNSRVALT